MVSIETVFGLESASHSVSHTESHSDHNQQCHIQSHIQCHIQCHIQSHIQITFSVTYRVTFRSQSVSHLTSHNFSATFLVSHSITPHLDADRIKDSSVHSDDYLMPPFQCSRHTAKYTLAYKGTRHTPRCTCSDTLAYLFAITLRRCSAAKRLNAAATQPCTRYKDSGGWGCKGGGRAALVPAHATEI